MFRGERGGIKEERMDYRVNPAVDGSMGKTILSVYTR